MRKRTPHISIENSRFNADAQQNYKMALGKQDEGTKGMVLVNGPVCVRITRFAKHTFDDDNYIGGCKALRDAISRLLGLNGDAVSDGVTFEYRQQKTTKSQYTEIEIFKT